MTAQETAVQFSCQGDRLVGVLTQPALGAAHDIGVLVVVGGPQYRAGSHRQFVQLARHIAASGHATMRFDVRGMGDSEGQPRGFEDQDADIAAAIDEMYKQVTGLHRIVLWGLCDGASAALIYWQRIRDRRVAGLCLLNPWVRSAATQASVRVKHYYVERLRDPKFWRKLFGGRVAASALREALGSVRMVLTGQRKPASGQVLSYQALMARAWADFDGPLLLLLSGRDYTAREFTEAVASSPEWRGAWDKTGLTRHDLPDADHTFSDARSCERSEQLLVEWLANALRV